jgi:hypothetical protein
MTTLTRRAFPTGRALAEMTEYSSTFATKSKDVNRQKKSNLNINS